MFNGKGTRTHLTPPKGVHYQWARKGSYRIEQNLGVMISYQIDLLCSQNSHLQYMYWMVVQLMLEGRQASFKKGYILVIISGGITGDIQISDKNCHRGFKNHYRDLEMKLILEQLEKDPIKIPSPLRNEMMSMLLEAWETLECDTKREFKSLFVTNTLDWSEDYLVPDKLFALIGDEIIELMSQNSVKTLVEVIRNLLPPKGIRRKVNVEGSKFLDFEG